MVDGEVVNIISCKIENYWLRSHSRNILCKLILRIRRDQIQDKNPYKSDDSNTSG